MLTGPVAPGTAPIVDSAPGWVQQATAPPATSKRPAWVIPVLAIGGALILVAGVVGVANILSSDSETTVDSPEVPDLPAVPATTALDVTLTVFDEDGCNFGWGYDDVPGAIVTVSMDGVPIAFDQLPLFGDDGIVYCEFEVSVAGVPTDGNIYEIEIGRRGKAVMSRAELIADSWSYNGSLGL